MFGDPFLDQFLPSPFGRPQREPEEIRADLLQPQTPEEEESLARKALNLGLGTLGFAGSTLDKLFGGRAVRQIASGLSGGEFNPRELLSILPGSDVLGITNEEQAVTGQQLAEKWGLQDPNRVKPEGFWANVGDLLPGLAVDVALDPGTYLTLGGKHALTAAGKAAKKTGQLAPTYLERIAQGQQGLFGLGIPGFEKTVPGFATGQKAADFASGVGKAVEWLPSQLPFYPAAKAKLGDLYERGSARLAQAFNPDVHGTAIPEVQREFLSGVNKTADDWKAAKLAELHGMQQELNAAGRYTPDYLADLRRIAETPGFPGPYDPLTMQASDLIRSLGEQAHTFELGAGKSAIKLSDPYAQYVPRQLELMPEERYAAFGNIKGRDVPIDRAQDIQRVKGLREIPGGTSTIEAMVQDPIVSGAITRTGLPFESIRQPEMRRSLKQIRETHFGLDPAEIQNIKQTFKAQKSLPETTRNALKEVYKARDIGVLQNRPVLMADVLNAVQTGQALSVDQFDKLALWQRATKTGRYLGELPLAHVQKNKPLFRVDPFEDLIDRIGSAAESGRSAQAVSNILEQRALDRALSTTKDIPLSEAQAQLGLTPTDTLDRFVKPDLVERLGQKQEVLQIPGPLKPVVNAFDWLQNLFKSSVVSTFPLNLSTSSRNIASNVNKVLAEEGPAGFRNYQKALGILSGKAPNPDVARQAAATNLIPQFVWQEATGGAANAPLPGLARIPGEIPQQPLYKQIPEDILGMFTGKTSPNPFAVRGVGGPDTQFGLAKAGGELIGRPDEAARLAMFMNRLDEGFTPVAAKAAVDAVFGGPLTRFERDVMQRLIPFYRWTKANVPYEMREMLQNPGGLERQLARFTGQLKQQEGFLPQYLGEGVAAPIGEEDAGVQRYLTRTDLPFEQPFELLSVGASPLQTLTRTGQKLLGQLSPAIKGPLELMTGKQFYSNRDLADLYSPTGSVVLDQILSNSPLTRLGTVYRTLTHPNADATKLATNLLTGLKLSDVDVAKERERRQSSLYDEMLATSPNIRKFSTAYVPQAKVGNLTPEEIETYKAYQAVQKRLREMSRQQRQGQ